MLGSFYGSYFNNNDLELQNSFQSGNIFSLKPLLPNMLVDGGGACWAAIRGVAQSRTRLKRLSSSSSSRVDFNLKPYLLSSMPFLANLNKIK